MTEKWSKEQAWAWYSRFPWLRGCNFIGSDCANRIDQWQRLNREAHMETADRELALCEKIGFNTIRIIVEFDVWVQERESFLANLEQYIALADRHHQLVMLVLANEAQLCRGDAYTLKPVGEQKYALGYHQGRLPLTPEQRALAPFHPMEKPGWKEKYLEMVREIVGKYAKDPRVLCWNVYNEPGIALGERSIPILRALFQAVREEDPIQPLCADVWNGLRGGAIHNEQERVALALSDVISYHNYTPYAQMIPELEWLQARNRPILMTEWLNRISRSTVEEIYPLLYLENVACWCWGFVVGKTQTQEPWDGLWEQYERSGGALDIDFTKWQHDLFRPNLRPYDPKEIELIRRYHQLAEDRFRRLQTLGKEG